MARWPVLSRPLIWLVGISVIGFALRLYRLDYQSVWYDEAFSIVVSRQPLGNLLEQLIGYFQPPLHYLLLHAMLALRDTGSFEARLLSAALGAAAVPLLFFAGRTLLGTSTGLIAATLLAVSQLAVMYSQEVRFYAQQQMLVCATLLLFGLAMHTRKRRWWWAFVVSGVLATYTHYYSAFFFMPLFVWALLSHQRLPPARVIAGLAVSALLFGPWLVVVDAALSSPNTIRDQPSYFAVTWHTPLETVNFYNNGNVLDVLSPGPRVTYLVGALLFTTPALMALGYGRRSRPLTRAQDTAAWILTACAIGVLGLATDAGKSGVGLSLLVLFRAVQIATRTTGYPWIRSVTSDGTWGAALVLAAVAVQFGGTPRWIFFTLGLLIGHWLSARAPCQTGPATRPVTQVSQRDTLAGLAAAWMLPVGIPLLLGTWGVQYDVRYTLAGLPAYYLLVAYGLSSTEAPKWRQYALAAGLGYALLALRANYLEPYKEDWRDALAVLAEGYRVDECVVFAPFGNLPLQWQVYGFDRRQPSLKVIPLNRLSDEVPSCSRLWLLSYSRTRRTEEESDTIRRFVEATQRETRHYDFHWVDVGAYARRD